MARVVLVADDGTVYAAWHGGELSDGPAVRLTS